jgi:putative endonuclease
MYYVYLLRNDKNAFYIGSTSDLKRRFDQHNQGRSVSTRDGAPWTLIYYEAYTTKQYALIREMKLKHHGKGISDLKKRLGFVE